MSKFRLCTTAIVGLLFFFLELKANDNIIPANEQDSGGGYALTSNINGNSPKILDIIKSIPAPGSTDPRGLTWDGEFLWMAEDDTKLIYKIDTLAGTVIDSFPTPGTANTQGLAWDGVHLWHAEYNGMIFKVDPGTGTFMDTITAPTIYPTGLAWDGAHIWVASYRDDYYYQISPIDGSLIHSFPSPETNPWGLTWADTSLWNCQLSGGDIFEFNPITGAVINSYASPLNSNLLGLTTDGAHLWAVDGNTNTILKLDLAAPTGLKEVNQNANVNTYFLHQNYPNPFNPSTNISFKLPKAAQINLEIYNTAGQKITTLLNKHMAIGLHNIPFDAQKYPSGIYYYRLQAADFQDIKKMVLLK